MNFVYREKIKINFHLDDIYLLTFCYIIIIYPSIIFSLAEEASFDEIIKEVLHVSDIILLE